MNKNITKLKNNFYSIKERRWIKGISNSDGSVGTTFEYLLGRKENNSILPDYNGIELKCTASFYSYPITLFSLNFDGPTKYETQRIANLYGKQDSIIKDKKTIYAALSCNKNYLVNNLYNFRLKINKESKLIYLVIYDINQKLIEEKSFVKFDTIQKHLFTKLDYLAMISARKKYINGNVYFNYDKIEFFKLKSFDYFIKAIENDKVKISLILRINKSKSNYGKPCYKNITFSIKKYNLKFIFTII